MQKLNVWYISDTEFNSKLIKSLYSCILSSYIFTYVDIYTSFYMSRLLFKGNCTLSNTETMSIYKLSCYHKLRAQLDRLLLNCVT